MTSVTSKVEPTSPAPSPAPAPGAVRGGAMLFAAMVASTGATYLFYLVSGRLLGPAEYGELAALIALVTLAALPFSAVQLALSREVSGLRTRGEAAGADLLSGRVLRGGAIATVVLVAVFTAVMVPLADLLKLDSVGPMGFVAATLAPTILLAVLLGDLQGRQEFQRLSVGTAFPLVARLAIFLVLAGVGWRLYGALTAMAVGAVAGIVLVGWWRRELVVRAVSGAGPAIRPFVIHLLPVLIAVLGVTALTNVDVLIVKARLASEDAGVYGAASAFAKVAFFLPTAIVGVVFPRVAARIARGEETDDILGRALVVTVGFCAVLFSLYGLIGGPLVGISYGAEFEEAASLLGLFGAGMTFFSLANVLVSYHLSRNEPRFAWVVAGGAVCQAVALAVVPADLDTFLWVNAGIGLGLMAAHELLMGSSLPAVRAGFGRGRDELVPRIADWAARSRARLVELRYAFLEAGLVLAGFTAFCVLITWPLTAHFATRTWGGGGDVFGQIADFWRQVHFTGFHVTGTSYVTNTGAPYGWEQGNGVNVQLALAYFPAYLVAEAFGEIAALNFAAFSGVVLSAAAMYWLTRRLTGSIFVAGWAGVVFAVFPWHLWKAEAHASLAHLEGFPLLALALVAWYRSPGARSLALLAAVNIVLWLTSGYYGVIAIVAQCALLPLVAWFQRRRFGLGGAVTRLGGAGLVAMVVAGVVWGIASLGAARGEISPVRQVNDLAYFGARIWEFFIPSYDNVLFGDLTASFLSSHQHMSNFAETSLYVGWVTLALAVGYVLWCFLRRRGLTEERRFVCAALSVTVVVALLFMPPYPVSIGSVEIPTLPWVLWKLVPQFRVPTRFMPLLMTGVVALAALGLVVLRDTLVRHLRVVWRAAAGAVLVVAVATLSFFELSTTPPPLLVEIGVLPQYQLLDETAPGILIEYPMAAHGDALNSEYTFWQRYHRRPLVNGAQGGTFAFALREALVDPTQPGVAGGLATLGVTAVTTRPGVYPHPSGEIEVPRDLGEGYRLVGRTYEDIAVWEVTAEPEPLAVFAHGFSYSEKIPGIPLSRWISEPRAAVVVIAPKAGRYLVGFRAQSFDVPRRLVLRGEDSSWAVDIPVDGSAFFIPMELERGRSTIALSTDPGPTKAPEPDPRDLSVFVSNWTFEPLERPAPSALRPALRDPVPAPERPARLPT